MALQTPRQRLQRPSYGNTHSAEKMPNFSASTTVNHKASLRALNGQSDPRTPAGKMDGGDLEVGDTVNVPGDMYGNVKFVGSVRGKNGRFVGVELGREFAARGKNDGDVDGIHYFNTTIPGAGIFLPVHRAEKRFTPIASPDSFLAATPGTPSHSTLNGLRTKGPETYTPPTPALPHKFSQSVGPGALRPSSPQFKPKRPSLPRPESPLRRPPPNLAPTPARTFSQSVRGGRPALGSATTPSKTNLRASTTTRPTTSHTPRPYSRAGSRLGNRPDAVKEEDRTPVGVANTSNGRTTSTNSVPSFSQPLRSPSRLGSAGGQDAEIQRLKRDLAERDRRLDEQAASLADMEASVKELSAIIPADGLTPGGARRRGSGMFGDEDEQTAAQLRQVVREKNEKIGLLTQEFDAHRADFRSTLDSLEMASTETERVYEEQKRDLLAQIAGLQEISQSKEDFEGVARQLKQLEELVQELEEGLEESRRGEAEARGEVEFLRGEVERGRSELRRERDKAAAVQKTADSGNAALSSKEVMQKDDEIRGLKAIIHNLSSAPHGSAANGDDAHASGADGDELKRLQEALDDSRQEKEDLEQEVEHLRRETAALSNGNGNGHPSHARNESQRTAKAAADRDIPIRTRSGTIKATFAEHARHSGLEEPTMGDQEHEHEHDDEEEHERNGTAADEEEEGEDDVYCEMCESKDHDTLDCGRLSHSASSPSKEQNGGGGAKSVASMLRHHDGAQEGKDDDEDNAVPGEEDKGEAKEDEDKWCALCEKDGHLAFDCPEEQY